LRDLRGEVNVNIPRSFVATAFLIALVCLPGARGASIGPGALVAPVVTTFDGLGLTQTQPLPFTANGNTFSSGVQNTFFYSAFGGGGNCFANECIGSSSAQGALTITLGTAALRAGFYLGVSSTQVTFFDTTGGLLDSETVTPLVVDGSNVWIGWQADSGLIGSIALTGLDSTHTFTIDNLTTEVAGGTANTPEPSSPIQALSGIAMLGYAVRRLQGRRLAE
jgi:hypothetical protein